MSKTLEKLVSDLGISTLQEMMNREVLNLANIQFKSQKMALMNKLNNLFNGEFLDGFSDCTYGNFLSRALTAYVISKEFDIPENEAAKYITDDTCDYGIDGLYFYKDTIYLYQTKFSNSLKRDNISIIKDGIKMLFSYTENENKFNYHFKSHKAEILKFMNDENLKVSLKIIFFGEQIPTDIDSFLNNEIKKNQEFGDFIGNVEILKKTNILDLEIENKPITYSLLLDNYFERELPLKMYAGCIKVNTLKHMYQKYGDRLFYRNIRYLIKDSNINDAIQKTLRDEPENFIYYNNGITITCDKISVLPNSSTSQILRNLKLYNVNIVNGAQTVISSSLLDDDINDNALIQIRIIQTHSEKSDYIIADNITKYNNSQNAVYIKDLRTLDPIHKEIRREFIKWGYYYKCKTGEKCVTDNDIDFEDLFIALACYYGHSHIAKINKGRIWETNLYHELLKIKKFEMFLKLAILKKKIEKCAAQIEKDEIGISHWDRLIIDLYYRKHFNIEQTLQEIEAVNCMDEVSNLYMCIKDYLRENPHVYRTKSTYDSIIQTILNGKINLGEDKQLSLFQ